MEKTTTQTTPANHDAIARCAYFIWKKEGCPEGRDVEFWTRAEAELEATLAPAARAAAQPMPAAEFALARPMSGKAVNSASAMSAKARDRGTVQAARA